MADSLCELYDPPVGDFTGSEILKNDRPLCCKGGFTVFSHVPLFLYFSAGGEGDPVNGGDSSGVPFYAPVIVILSLLSFMCVQCCRR